MTVPTLAEQLFLLTRFLPLWRSREATADNRFVDISMDTHHPGLINDCLISIFTFLKEDDLVVASCVCKVSGVMACGSTCATKG